MRALDEKPSKLYMTNDRIIVAWTSSIDTEVLRREYSKTSRVLPVKTIAWLASSQLVNKALRSSREGAK
jgi:hypothetical protein